MTKTVPGDNLPNGFDQIAIIGLSARFPGAPDVHAFWDMLESGNDGLLKQPAENEVQKACFSMPERFVFDADFFGFSPNEAALTDPQHRVFLECAWHALEDAGYGDRSTDDRTGIYAACGFNDYVLRHVGMRDFSDSAAEMFAMMIGNDKDFLANRAAHLLNLTGPALVNQSACSSGLLCVHQATQALLQGEINMALAGAASISVSLEDGYFPDPGGVMSPNAQIAPFSKAANGIVGGNGAAVLVLKRLEDALIDHDYIYATIAGSAANNDGAARAAFTAPSVSGQTAVLQEALDLSNCNPDDISYIEAHGTGTPLGDPIETESIRQVYGERNTTCHLGSVKANVGHLNAAAGLAGLIKVIGILERQVIPPTLHLGKHDENPDLGLNDTKLLLTPSLVSGETHRFAAVSSFGFGGTNVHQIIGCRPGQQNIGQESTEAMILPLSAKTEAALQLMKNALAQHLESTDYNLPDVSKSLLCGRSIFPKRSAVTAINTKEAANKLKNLNTVNASGKGSEVVFVFPGQGTQFVGMGLNLYQRSTVFKDRLDEAAEILLSLEYEDIRTLIFAADEQALASTEITQIVLFAVEYACACWLIDGGLSPVALLGHSIGEYVAATVAGVFSLKDALMLVGKRGRLVASLAASGMLAINASEQAVREQLTPELSLAVVNRSDQVVISGTDKALMDFESTVQQQGWRCRRLTVSHGFHSHLLEPILDEFEALFDNISLNKPTLPVYSNKTGGLASPTEIVTPLYWRDHLRDTVRFADNLDAIKHDHPRSQLLTVGPGSVPGSLPLMLTAQSQKDDCLAAIAQLWVDGASVEQLFHDGSESWYKVPLPGYQFTKVEHCLPILREAGSAESNCWTYVPQWHRICEIKSETQDMQLCWVNDHVQQASDINRLAEQIKKLSNSHLVLVWHEQAENILRQITQHILPAQAVLSITLITQKLVNITANEALQAAQAQALGVLRSIPFEIPNIKTIWLDCDCTPNERDMLRVLAANTDFKKLQADALGLRDGILWRRQLMPQLLPKVGVGDLLKSGATYVIAGGLGALGRCLAKIIAPLGVHLVLISRNIPEETLIQPESDTDLAEIIAAGSTFSLHPARVQDVDAMQALADQLQQEGHKIAGMFNLAGRYVSQTIVDTPINEQGPNYNAKVLGTRSLLSAFAKFQPKFFAVFGSLATETSGYGNADYIAANLYAEMLSQTEDNHLLRVIAWDNWSLLGGLDDNASTLFNAQHQRTINVEQGLQQLWNILSAGLPYVVVTPTDIETRLTFASDAACKCLQQSDENKPQISGKPQIAIDQPLVVQFAQYLFAEMLGLSDIMPSDDFILRGGDSITAVRLLSRLRKITRADIALADFMGARTPIALAALMINIPNIERIARTYLHVQFLSNQERDSLREELRT